MVLFYLMLKETLSCFYYLSMEQPWINNRVCMYSRDMHSPVSGSQTSAPVQLQVWLHPAPYEPELHTESHQTTIKSQNVIILFSNSRLNKEILVSCTMDEQQIIIGCTDIITFHALLSCVSNITDTLSRYRVTSSRMCT